MKTSLFTTTPYTEMLSGGMFPPIEQPDGSFLWQNPAGKNRVPMICLQDLGPYFMWLLDNPSEAAGKDLKMASFAVSFDEVAETFSNVTGKKGVYRYTPFDSEYVKIREPWENAPSSWAAGPGQPVDESVMSWRQNFSAWWKFYDEAVHPAIDYELLDRINPNRIKSLEEWMRKTGYEGKEEPVLKDIRDLRKEIQELKETKEAGR
jgi:hypothetical protein